MLLSSSVLARAAEEGGSAAEQPVGTAFKWIHFVILAGLAYWVFAKLLPPVFRRNADNITAAISKATAAKTEAEKKLQDAAAKLASLEKEIAEFRAIAQREAARRSNDCAASRRATWKKSAWRRKRKLKRPSARRAWN